MFMIFHSKLNINSLTIQLDNNCKIISAVSIKKVPFPWSLQGENLLEPYGQELFTQSNQQEAQESAVSWKLFSTSMGSKLPFLLMIWMIRHIAFKFNLLKSQLFHYRFDMTSYGRNKLNVTRLIWSSHAMPSLSLSLMTHTWLHHTTLWLR